MKLLLVQLMATFRILLGVCMCLIVIVCPRICLLLFLSLSVIFLLRINQPRKQGGLGEMKIPLLADRTASISKHYGVYIEESGVTFRCV